MYIVLYYRKGLPDQDNYVYFLWKKKVHMTDDPNIVYFCSIHVVGCTMKYNAVYLSHV